MDITRTATLKKITPGAVQYKEDIPEGEDKTFGSIYLRKSFINSSNGGKTPEKLSVTVKAL